MAGATHTHLSELAVNKISSRLSDLPLRLPLSAGESPDSSKKAEYLANLLRRDPGVFLERHADALNANERALFEPLRGDYEVDFYLKQQEDAAKESREVTVRNRRLARMNQLESDGEYFTEEAMRQRAPALHEQYMGSGSAPMPALPRGNDTFDRLEREAMLQEQRNADLKDVRPVNRMHGEEEEEEEEEDDDQAEEGAAPRPRLASDREKEAAASSMQEDDAEPSSRAGAAEGESGGGRDFDMLLSVMKARFMAGQDGGVDYKALDVDASLDDDWAAVKSHDAQERYFDAD